jgi:hypothetical protein
LRLCPAAHPDLLELERQGLALEKIARGSEVRPDHLAAVDRAQRLEGGEGRAVRQEMHRPIPEEEGRSPRVPTPEPHGAWSRWLDGAAPGQYSGRVPLG